MFDEEPDGDPHGECREEIRRLEARYHADVDGAISAMLRAEARAIAWKAVADLQNAGMPGSFAEIGTRRDEMLAALAKAHELEEPQP